MRNLKSLALFLAAAVITGCSTDSVSLLPLNEQDTAIQSVKRGISPNTLNAWNQYVNQVRSTGKIQKGCTPFYKKAEGNVTGSVMLFHGYSACPQQYEELSALLSKQGFNVFVPLLPGHGKQQIQVDGKTIDDSAQLPETDSINIYDNFAKNIGSILKDEPGTKVVAGLSVGGALAARVMLYHSDIYDRALLMAPFFNAAAPVNVLLPALGAIVPNRRMSWGEGCEKQRQGGRAGYCNFKIGNVAAVRKFGLETLKQVANINKPVQITGVEKDPAASNSAIAEAARTIPNSQTCFFAKGASHSMLSRIDNIGIEMFWLRPLQQQIVQYVVSGKNFDITGNSEHNLGLCRSF